MMTPALNIAGISHDPLWFPYRYDPGQDAVQFRHLTRAQHRAATFVTDEYLGKTEPSIVNRSVAMAGRRETGPVHFIFHSAFCCSTVLARAFDLPGVAMGLKEPPLFNDLIGWQLRGGTAAQIAPVLDDLLKLLARPFSPGEAVVIKPSNLANGLAPGMLMMRPDAQALLLHAPLPVYLGSIAKKAMTGRLWVRELLVKQLQQGLHNFGYSTEDYLGQTDLQAAAIGWLAQHALFAQMVAHFPDRVRTIDSETLMARPVAAMAALAALYGLSVDAAAVVAGPAFTRHSKSEAEFSAIARSAEIAAANSVFADEIDKVTIWTAAVAASAGVPMTLGAPLL